MHKFEVKPLKSGRDNVKVLPCMKEYIQGFGAHIFCGKTQSGKSCLIANLLMKGGPLDNFYDYIYLFCLSPSKLILEHCPAIKKNNVIRDDDPKILKKIVDTQKNNCERNFKKSPFVLIILDDVISSTRFLNCKALKDLFFGGTNFKTSVFVCTQSYVKIPRSLRINNSSITLYHGLVGSELERFADEYRPAEMKEKDFISMVKHAIKEPYSYLFCNNLIADKTKIFRKNHNVLLEFTKPIDDQNY